MRIQWWFVIAGILGAIGVSLGAFHAHGLHKVLANRMDDVSRIAQRMDQFETAVRYQMIHALALFVVAVVASQTAGRLPHMIGWAFLLGTLLFCGTLYAIVATDNGYYGRFTPLGGLALIAGWVLVAVLGWMTTVPQ